MARGFTLARIPSGTPNVVAMRVTAAQAFAKGALVIDTAAGTISECGADPTAVLGVALQGAFTGPGNNNADSPVVITGQMTDCSVAMFDRSQVFSCRGVNGATDPATPLVTNIGESYGCAKVSTDWVLDLAEVTVKQFKIVDIDIDNKIFFVKPLEAALSIP